MGFAVLGAASSSWSQGTLAGGGVPTPHAAPGNVFYACCLWKGRKLKQGFSLGVMLPRCLSAVGQLPSTGWRNLGGVKYSKGSG